jgi:hemin uptake protein HemP
MAKDRKSRPSEDPDKSASTPSPQIGGAAGADPVKRVDSVDLFGGASRLLIDHRGVTYTLLVTRNEKLILTK